MCFSCFLSRLSPYVVNAGCSTGAFTRMRRRMIPRAEGVVAEVGFGSGLNLPHYDSSRVKRLVGIDPDGTMLAMAEGRRRSVPFDVELIEADGKDIPLGAHSANTVVVTYTLCTVKEPLAVLNEIKRILKPSGRLIFIEHGRAEDAGLRKWQDRLDRPWGWLAGGCQLNREPLGLISDAGFHLGEVEFQRFPFPFWQLGNHYVGMADVDGASGEN